MPSTEQQAEARLECDRLVTDEGTPQENVVTEVNERLKNIERILVKWDSFGIPAIRFEVPE